MELGHLEELILEKELGFSWGGSLEVKISSLTLLAASLFVTNEEHSIVVTEIFVIKKIQKKIKTLHIKCT